MAYSAPSSRSTSDLITAAIWNADVVANPIAIYAGAMSVTSQAVGDILYASSTTQFARIAAVAAGQVLTSAGTGTVPAWSTDLVVSGAGPHAIGGSGYDFVRLLLDGAFTSGGASTIMFGTYMNGALTGHSADSDALGGTKLDNSIVTAGNCTTVAQLWVTEPKITVGAGTVTNSASLYVDGAATEATNDYAIWVDSGVSRFDGNVGIGTTHADAPNTITEIQYSDSSTTNVDNGLTVLNTNGSTGNLAGVRFSTSSGANGGGHPKQFIGAVRTSSDGIGDIVFLNRNVADTSIVAAADERMRITAAGDIYSTGWTDYYSSSTIVGWSSLTSGRRQIMYRTLGNMVFVAFHLEGTSDATTISFTVPYTSATIGSEWYYTSALGFTYDNGGYKAAGRLGLPSNSNVVSVHKAELPGGWTATGTKIVSGQFWYQKA